MLINIAILNYFSHLFIINSNKTHNTKANQQMRLAFIMLLRKTLNW